MTQDLSRHGATWEEGEMHALIYHFLTGTSVDTLARAHKRKSSAIESRLRMLLVNEIDFDGKEEWRIPMHQLRVAVLQQRPQLLDDLPTPSGDWADAYAALSASGPLTLLLALA